MFFRVTQKCDASVTLAVILAHTSHLKKKSKVDYILQPDQRKLLKSLLLPTRCCLGILLLFQTKHLSSGHVAI